MEKTADVVIIGGGIVGLSIAYYLALKRQEGLSFSRRGNWEKVPPAVVWEGFEPNFLQRSIFGVFA